MMPKPWEPVELEPAELAALKALAKGRADAGQQVMCLNIIIEKLSGTYQPSFRPDEWGGARATDYAEGARSVGLRIRHFITSPGGEYDRPNPEPGPEREPADTASQSADPGPAPGRPARKRSWKASRGE